ncbi:hypothetical protein [Aquabacterium sp.]
MNSVIDSSKPAELNRDAIAQRVTRFHEHRRADSILGPTFASERAHDSR